MATRKVILAPLWEATSSVLQARCGSEIFLAAQLRRCGKHATSGSTKKLRRFGMPLEPPQYVRGIFATSSSCLRFAQGGSQLD